MKELENNTKGFSLLEITVSIGIFSFLMILATGIFQSVIRGQGSAIASQDTQESLRYVYEVMGKEIRNAQRGTESDTVANSHICLLDNSDTDNRVFNISTNGDFGATSNIFYFKDKNGQCIYYFLINDVLMIHRDDMAGSTYTVATTPQSISVTAFETVINDNAYNEVFSNWVQPDVTFRVTAEAKGHEFLNNETKIQTTISSRMYE